MGNTNVKNYENLSSKEVMETNCKKCGLVKRLTLLAKCPEIFSSFSQSEKEEFYKSLKSLVPSFELVSYNVSIFSLSTGRRVEVPKSLDHLEIPLNVQEEYFKWLWYDSGNKEVPPSFFPKGTDESGYNANCTRPVTLENIEYWARL